MNYKRISLAGNLHPVENYFNWISSDDFIKALRAFSSGRGYNIEDNTCSFPLDLAEDDPGAEGDIDYIEFWTYSGNEEVRVKFAIFEDLIVKVARVEIERAPENAELINDLVSATVARLQRRS